MQISSVRQRLLVTIERARRAAVERRARAEEAARDYDRFLGEVAVPLVRMVASVLRAEGYTFNVFTPGGSVRLASDRSADDYVEIALDTTGEYPRVMGRTSRSRGRRGVDSERPLCEAQRVSEITDEDVLAFLLKELEPFVEK